jgi:hypothetical protein
VYFIMLTPLFAASLWSDIVTMYSNYFRNIFSYQEAILSLCSCMYVTVSLLISDKFCDLSLLH